MIEQSRFLQAACQARHVYFGCPGVALEIFIVSTKSLGSFGMTVVEINPGLKPGHLFEAWASIQEEGTSHHFPGRLQNHIFLGTSLPG